MRNDSKRTAAVLTVVALTLVACGRSQTATSTTADPTSAAAIDPQGALSSSSGASRPLPAVEVVDVATNEAVSLAGLLPAATPTLLWMWAPH
jgi:hypothetical protein